MSVGYGRLFPCRRPIDIAIVPFALLGGIDRSASNKAYMLVNGKPARASYDVKVGDILELQLGAKAVKARVLSVMEVVRKENAGEMYEFLP